jgi:hypothetical protein
MLAPNHCFALAGARVIAVVPWPLPVSNTIQARRTCFAGCCGPQYRLRTDPIGSRDCNGNAFAHPPSSNQFMNDGVVDGRRYLLSTRLEPARWALSWSQHRNRHSGDIVGGASGERGCDEPLRGGVVLGHQFRQDGGRNRLKQPVAAQ